MTGRRGRVVGWCSAGVGLAVLAGVLGAFHQTLLEKWYLLKLDSEDEKVVLAAGESLARMKSVKAIPVLFEHIRVTRTEGKAYFDYQDGNPVNPLFPGLEAHVEVLRKVVEASGILSVSYLIEEAKSADWYARLLAIVLLGELGPRARTALPTIKEALTDEKESVRAQAMLAVLKTQE